MTHTLRVISRDGETILGTVVWTDGVVQIRDAEKHLRAQFEIWVRSGLDELVGPHDGLYFRHTEPSNEEFLPRVAENIRRQTGMSVSLQTVP